MTRSDSPWASGDGETIVPSAPPVSPASDPNRRLLLWFGGGALLIIVVGLVVVLSLVLTGNVSSLRPSAVNGPDRRPPLAKLCPPPTAYPELDPGAAPPVPEGPRTVDPQAGVSYRAYGAPWQPWNTVWAAGTLGVEYGVGQSFVTERYSGGNYYASILSGSVPATANDGTQLDLKCTGQQVAADARVSYYPQPNTMEPIRDEAATLGGRPAWVSTFRLRFEDSASGLSVRDELVGIAMIDVGRPEAAVLYVSIPGTVRQYDNVVDEVLESVRYVTR